MRQAFPILTLFVALGGAARAGAQAQDAGSWPAYHGGPDLAGVAVSGAPDKPALRARVPIGGPVPATPVVAAGRVFFTAEESKVFAWNMRTGSFDWTRALEDNKRPDGTSEPASFRAPAICVDGLLIVGSEQGRVFALNAGNGETRWTYDLGGSIWSSAVWLGNKNARRVVLLSQDDGSAHCLDAATGKQVWKSPETNRSDGPPSTDGDVIAFGNCDAALYFLEADSGKLRARLELGEDSQVAGGVALSEGLAFAGARSGAAVCADPRNNAVVWTDRTSDGEVFATPAVDKTRAVFASANGLVFCLDSKTGAPKWKFQAKRETLSPVIAGRKVVVGARGVLYVLDIESGRQTWSYQVGDEITSPAVADGMIIVGTDDGIAVFGPEERQEAEKPEANSGRNDGQ